MPDVRLILDAAHSGAWNMAVDEVMLQSAIDSSVATVRIYLWDEPTLSLGYFQKAADAGPLAELLPIVRRLSGGGAILHHHELTYSIAIPASHPQAADPHGLYTSAHSAICDCLAKFGIHVEPRGLVQPELNTQFLCFARGDAVDLVIRSTVNGILETHKILGSAQRRRKGNVLQHGSLVLRASEHAPQFLGLQDLADLSTDEPPLHHSIGTALASVLGELKIDQLTPAELATTDRWKDERYSLTR